MHRLTTSILEMSLYGISHTPREILLSQRRLSNLCRHQPLYRILQDSASPLRCSTVSRNATLEALRIGLCDGNPPNSQWRCSLLVLRACIRLVLYFKLKILLTIWLLEFVLRLLLLENHLYICLTFDPIQI